MHAGGEAQRDDDAARVIVLPWRAPVLGESHESAEVIPFPCRDAADDPPDAPPRLAV